MKTIILCIYLISLFGCMYAFKNKAGSFKEATKKCCAKAFKNSDQQQKCEKTFEHQYEGSDVEIMYRKAIEKDTEARVESTYASRLDQSCKVLIPILKKQQSVITADKFGFILAAGSIRFPVTDLEKFTLFLAKSSPNLFDMAVKLKANYWQTLYTDDGMYIQKIDYSVTQKDLEDVICIPTIFSEEFKQFYEHVLHKLIVDVRGTNIYGIKCGIDDIIRIYKRNLEKIKTNSNGLENILRNEIKNECAG